MPAARPPIPRPALLIGIAGLAPFLFGAATSLLADDPLVAAWGFSALAAWAACCLSGLGAVHWGHAMHGGAPALRDLLVAASGPLVAWLALAFGGHWGLLVMAAGFLGYQAWDQRLAARGALPAWYPRLRLPLTGVVMVCLCAAALYGGP